MQHQGGIKSADHVQIEIGNNGRGERRLLCLAEGPGEVARPQKTQLFARPQSKDNIAFQGHLAGGLLRGERFGNAQDGRHAGGIVVSSKMDTALFILAGQRPIPQARAQMVDMRPNHNDTSVGHALSRA